jgi:hypothetical protein
MSSGRFRRIALALPGAMEGANGDATTLQSALTMAWQNIAPKSKADPQGRKKP